MTPEQALENLAQAVAQITANLATHQVLQTSVMTLRSCLQAQQAAARLEQQAQAQTKSNPKDQ